MLINQLPFSVSILIPAIFYVLTLDYTEVKPGEYPYIMFFDASTKVLKNRIAGVGVLVSDRVILTDGITASEVKKKPTFAYSGFSGVANSTDPPVKYNIWWVGYPHFWTVTLTKNNSIYTYSGQIGVIILDNPLKFEEGLHPVKIPLFYPNTVDVVHVGLSEKTGNLYHSKIKIHKWNVCIEKYQAYTDVFLEDFFTLKPVRSRFMQCSDVVHSKKSIIQGPLIIKGATPKDDLFIGLHTFDFKFKNNSYIAMSGDVVAYRHFAVINSNGSLSDNF